VREGRQRLLLHKPSQEQCCREAAMSSSEEFKAVRDEGHVKEMKVLSNNLYSVFKVCLTLKDRVFSHINF
jgi:hypothetical protein